MYILSEAKRKRIKSNLIIQHTHTLSHLQCSHNIVIRCLHYGEMQFLICWNMKRAQKRTNFFFDDNDETNGIEQKKRKIKIKVPFDSLNQETQMIR